MSERATVIGAGLAGCSAAAMLKARGYDVTVYERSAQIGGLCADGNGYQEYGPHAFHTDDDDVWRFVNLFAKWLPYVHRVHVLTDGGNIRELPLGVDPAFRVYTEKAWGCSWDKLPSHIKNRVPVVTDGRDGYHTGKYRAQPLGGYTRMMREMLDGVRVILNSPHRHGVGLTVFTGDLRELRLAPNLQYAYRRFVMLPGMLPHAQVNYATHCIPAIRAWDNQMMCEHESIVGIELPARPGDPGAVPCYPLTEASESDIRTASKSLGFRLCGRMGTGRYLDMDQTIRNVMDTLSDL